MYVNIMIAKFKNFIKRKLVHKTLTHERLKNNPYYQAWINGDTSFENLDKFIESTKK